MRAVAEIALMEDRVTIILESVTMARQIYQIYNVSSMALRILLAQFTADLERIEQIINKFTCDL